MPVRVQKVFRFGLMALLVWACVFLAVRGSTPEKSVQPFVAEQGRLTGKTIAVDAGHGGYDGGARARDSGLWEKEINLSVALKLKTMLEAEGATVIMTREGDLSLDTGGSATQTRKRQDMEARVALIREADPWCVISIHMNEYRNRSQSGPQVFFRKEHEASAELARVMQSALIETLAPPKKRAALQGDYFILSLDIPSVLVECGFLSNAAEEKLLLDADYQMRVAQAIVNGLCAYDALSAP